MNRLVLSMLLLAACGGDDDAGQPGDDAGGGNGDAGQPGDDAGGASGDAAPSASCVEYCDVVTAACVDELEQYNERPSCLASCALYPPGQADDDTGDSLGCRMHFAELAATEPDPSCVRAGPSGGGVCGETCDAYCDLILEVCDLYADDAACMETCATFATAPEPYSTALNRGDTAECRLFHTTRATAFDGHCGTASADSPPCSPQ